MKDKYFNIKMNLHATYLRRGAVREPWVGFKGDHLRVNYAFEFFCRHGAEVHRDHDVHLTVALQDRDVFLAAGTLWDKYNKDMNKHPSAQSADSGKKVFPFGFSVQ